ncbi:MAG: aminotransferase class V-fold PLP-dependent enzyme [Candidatus Eisenbacteria bacterium]|nr:aminotransferase class V-fold PLP-dependent enzyme [Candidatus Eisenbacteria bacterium]
MIYLDHGATSFPKPPAVVRAVRAYLEESAANPGRSGHRLSAAAARVIYDARAALARLLGAPDPRQIVFTGNATGALNLALHGVLRPGDHVVTTSMEHNSVMRPLQHLRQTRGIRVRCAPADVAGRIDAGAIADALETDTRLVVVNHASNVVGTIAPLAEIRRAIGDRLLLVDAAQTAGATPIDVTAPQIDLLAFTGHKSLLGPQGTGGLYIRPGVALEPLMPGGTGSRSESDSQPDFLPDRYEGGTPNGPGIAGLGAGVSELLERGMDAVREHEARLLERLLARLQEIAGVTLWGPHDAAQRIPAVSLRLDGMAPSELAHALDRRYGVLARAGLHCAPQAHRTLGTFPEGSLRLSCGWTNTPQEIDGAAGAIAELAREAMR